MGNVIKPCWLNENDRYFKARERYKWSKREPEKVVEIEVGERLVLGKEMVNPLLI